MKVRTYKGIESEEDLKWEELRRLFVGDEKAEIQRLQEFLDNPEKFAIEVSKALPDAVNLSRERSEDLTEALTEALRPIIEEAIQKSTRRSTKPLSEGLFPIIGPAIRSAVREVFKKMNETINSTLGNTLSFKGIKWRIEAWRTGRSYMEVMVAHTMLYQVKQVFLIHKETGLLLQHVASDYSQTKDADMVSSMLTAIQDFVKDSFSVEDEDELSTIEMGEHTIWIEQGPRAILACVVYGNAPLKIRDTFKRALEKIHIEFIKELKEFDGNLEPFAEDTQQVESCLLGQGKEGVRKKTPFAKWVILAVILGLLGYWLVSSILEDRRWSAYLEKIDAQQGIIIIEEGRKKGKFYVKGMMTPGSPDPAASLDEFGFDPSKVTGLWQYYQPLEPGYLLARAKRLLKPPETVTLEIKGSVLYARGLADEMWREDAGTLTGTIWEISELNTDGLIDKTAFEDFTQTIPKIERLYFWFYPGSTSIMSRQNKEINMLVRNVQKLIDLSIKLNKEINIEISGYADITGNKEINRKISLQRANTIYNVLIANGISSDILTTKTFIQKVEPGKEISEEEKRKYRRVSLKVNFSDK